METSEPEWIPSSKLHLTLMWVTQNPDWHHSSGVYKPFVVNRYTGTEIYSVYSLHQPVRLTEKYKRGGGGGGQLTKTTNRIRQHSWPAPAEIAWDMMAPGRTQSRSHFSCTSCEYRCTTKMRIETRYRFWPHSEGTGFEHPRGKRPKLICLNIYTWTPGSMQTPLPPPPTHSWRFSIHGSAQRTQISN